MASDPLPQRSTGLREASGLDGDTCVPIRGLARISLRRSTRQPPSSDAGCRNRRNRKGATHDRAMRITYGCVQSRRPARPWMGSGECPTEASVLSKLSESGSHALPSREISVRSAASMRSPRWSTGQPSPEARRAPRQYHGPRSWVARLARSFFTTHPILPTAERCRCFEQPTAAGDDAVSTEEGGAPGTLNGRETLGSPPRPRRYGTGLRMHRRHASGRPAASPSARPRIAHTRAVIARRRAPGPRPTADDARVRRVDRRPGSVGATGVDELP